MRLFNAVILRGRERPDSVRNSFSEKFTVTDTPFENVVRWTRRSLLRTSNETIDSYPASSALRTARFTDRRRETFSFSQSETWNE